MASVYSRLEREVPMYFRALLAVWIAVLAAVCTFGMPAPKVTLPSPQVDALIGETVKFCVLFENDQGSPGFAPFIDLVFDQHGADGNAGAKPCDGLSFVKAELVEVNPSPVPLPPVALPATVGPCGNGSATHPFAGSTPGWPAASTPSPGSQMVTLALPFGGFDQSQPPMKIEVTALLSSLADDAHPLSVYVRGGFRFGDDALNLAPNQPVFDGSAISSNALSWTTQTITPRAVFLTKRFLGAEDEVVPGPNFPDDYAIAVHVAPSQVISNLTLSDCASQDVTFIGVTAAGTVTVPSSAPNCFTVQYPQLTGPPSGVADTITAHFYVNDFPELAAGCSAMVSNEIHATAGSWKPLDTRDAMLNPIVASAAKTIQRKAVALLKSAKISGPAIPPAVVTYTLSFRISDYATFRDLVITDTLSDGLVYVPGSATYSVSDQAHSDAGTIPPKYVIVKAPVQGTYTCPADASALPCMPQAPGGPVVLQGSTQITFVLYKAMSGAFPSGIVTGGGPTGATGTITFQARIDPKFAHGPHSSYDKDQTLDKEDPLLNHAEIAGTLLEKTGESKCGDDSNVCLSVPGDTLEKRIVAKNGVLFGTLPGPISVPLPRFQRGDTITYQLEKTIPSGNAEDLTVEDWPPRPVLLVPAVIAPQVPPCAGAVGSQPVCYVATGPVSQPIVTTDTARNSFAFTFNDWSNLPNTPVTITLRITLKVNTDPFADGLFLTNEAQECERNSYGTRFCQTAIAQFELGEPSLRIRKGILCPMSGCALVPPIKNPPFQARMEAAIGPIAICGATSCPRFFGTVHSGNVSGFVSNTSALADAGDVVHFAIVVENIGNGQSGAYDIAIKDSLPTEMAYVANTLCVTRGDGTPISFVEPNGAFPASLELVDGVSGALGAYSPTSGHNIAVITFDARLKPPGSVQIGSCPQNQASLTTYSNQEQGSNFVTAGFAPPFSAIATVCVTPKEIVKRITQTSEVHTGTGAPRPLTIGEIAGFNLTVAVPEGVASTFDIIDALPAGLQLIGPPNVSPKISTSGVATSMTWASVTFSGPATWRFQKLVNNDNDPDCEYLTITFNALVLNSAANNHGDGKTNRFTVKAGPNVIGTSSDVHAVIVEPLLSVKKSVVVTPAGIVFAVLVENNAGTTAFDVVITDSPGACIQGLAISGPIVRTAGVAVPVINGTKVSVASIPVGGKVTVNYRASTKCGDCKALNNTATVTWTSLPGLGTPVGPLNQTGSATPGQSGASTGERRSPPSLLAQNDYVATASVSLCSRVCGIKFSDDNGNGRWDEGEKTLSGWTITATDAAGKVVAKATTDERGRYCFDLPPGKFTLCEAAQPKWYQTFPVPACHTVVVSPGMKPQEFNFGNRFCWAKVCGMKRSKAGAPLSGWTIFAQSTAGGPRVAEVKTNADGRYCLELTGPGPYTISEAQQPGWLMVAPDAPYQVRIECQPAPGKAIVNGVRPDALDFTNDNLCAKLACPKSAPCMVFRGVATCVKAVKLSPCALVSCGAGKQCKVVQGLPKCLP